MSSQDQRMRQILARFEVWLSYGATQAFDKSGGRVKATGGNRPQGDSSPVHELYRVLYDRAQTAAERENVIVAAEQEFEKLSHTRPPAIAPEGSIHWKREIANRTDKDEKGLCDEYSISRATLYRYRRDYRRDAA